MLAADQFIITPAGRVEEAARAKAAGEDVRTVIAGYHWFTDWGRDTMISLEGLTLGTGRLREAAYILRTFAHYVRDGLIPNMFPDGAREGLYHTADATLWFFHAINRYVRATGDTETLRALIPTLVDIVRPPSAGHALRHRRRSADGLLRQGAEGYQLTWMDAKVDDWVVTPRRGKAVEINALWFNALCLLCTAGRHSWASTTTLDLRSHAARARHVIQRAILVSPTAATSSTSSTASAATTGVPAQSGVRDLARSSGARRVAMAAGDGGGPAAAAHAGRPALAGARTSRLQAEVLWRSALARRGVPPGHGLGVADWPLRRCVVEGASRAIAPVREVCCGASRHT